MEEVVVAVLVVVGKEMEGKEENADEVEWLYKRRKGSK